MKIAILVIKNLFIFIKTQKKVMLIMLVSLVTTTFASLYLFSIYEYVNNDLITHNSLARTLTIQFDLKDSIKKKHDFLYWVGNTKEMPEIQDMYVQTIMNDKKGEMYVIGINENYPYLYLMEGRKFSKEEINKSANNVIISAKFYRDYGKKIMNTKKMISGKEYNVIGITDITLGDVFIPFSTYLKNGYDISECTVVYKNIIDGKQEQLIKDMIEKDLSSVNIIYPEDKTLEYVTTFSTALILIFILLFFCMINIISLYKYWIEQNTYRFAIYKICGAKKFPIYFFIIMEVFVIGVIGFVIGIIPYSLLVPYLKEFDVFKPLLLSQIGFVFMLYILSIFLSVLGIARKVSKAVPIDKSLWG